MIDPEVVEAFVTLMPDGDWIEAMADERGYAERLKPLREIAVDDLEIAMVGPGGFTGTFKGVDGFRDAWSDWLEPFESYSIEPQDFRESGDRILFTGRQKAVPKGAEAEIESEAAAVFVFGEDGRLQRMEFHLDPEAARRSAGLAEG